MDYACWQVLKYSRGSARVHSLRALSNAHAHTQAHRDAHNQACYNVIFGSVSRTHGATHVSESVPGSVLAVLSRGARPFLVSGECRACAQQESHDRQQEEEHLLTAKRHRR